MSSTDVSQTLDTEGVVGNHADAPIGTSGTAGVADTSVYGGGGGGDNNKPATQPDTEGFGAGTSPYGVGSPSAAGTDVSAFTPSSVYSQQAVTGTLDTQSGGGSPIQQANPAYRAPADYAATGSVADTTRTDSPVSDFTGNPGDPLASEGVVAGNMDTVNPTYPMQSSGTLRPAAPGTPTVAAGNRSVTVSWSAVADPAGAKVRGYRIEGSTGGVDFAGRDATSYVIETLVPSQSYKFRIAAYNDNGESAFSAFSAAVTPLNPDEPGPGHAVALDPANTVNPIYSPDGTIKAGTNLGGGSATTYPVGAVGSPTAAADATSGDLLISWTAPTYGFAEYYHVVLSTGEVYNVPAGTLSYLFTGLSSVSRTATITPVTSRGNGPVATTNAATAHA